MTDPAAVVVNSDPDQLNILTGLLRQAGLKPIPIAGAEAALAAMEPSNPPALIVTDLYMPGLDGWRFCRLLRSPEYAAFNMVPILVVSAPTPGEALRLAREHQGRVDLLMTDVVMPTMNGRDLAGELLSSYPGIRVLFMSGFTADVIAGRGVIADGGQFIQKPFSKADLAAKLGEVLK